MFIRSDHDFIVVEHPGETKFLSASSNLGESLYILLKSSLYTLNLLGGESSPTF